MNPRYEKYLVKTYVPLYQDRNKPMNETCMCWEFCCGDGWFNIINSLSMLLCNGWSQAKKEYDFIAGRVGQLIYPQDKETDFNKMINQEMVDNRALILDKEYDLVPKVVQVKEKFGSLRFYVSAATDEQYAMINLAEVMSSMTCEDCGKPGRIKAIGGWYRCQCPECRKKSFERLKKLYGVEV